MCIKSVQILFFSGDTIQKSREQAFNSPSLPYDSPSQISDPYADTHIPAEVSFFCRFPQICCQHVRCLFSMGYNTTAAACPCSHLVKTRSASRHLHTISHHFSTYNQQFYQNMCCFLLSFHKIHVSFLSCYVRLPKTPTENGSQKRFTIFSSRCYAVRK